MGVGCVRWLVLAVVVLLPLSACGSVPGESARPTRDKSVDKARDEDGGGGQESACVGRDGAGSKAQEPGQVEPRHPVVADVRTVDRSIQPGGAPVTFCVTVDNPTATSYDDVELSFTFFPGGEPSGPTLEWRSESGWSEVPLGWYDADEPGELLSDALIFDIEAGEARTIALRFRLPEGYTWPDSGIGDYGGEAILAGRSEGSNWGDRVKGPHWRLDHSVRTVLEVSGPSSLTLGGAPAVYTVAVDNRRGRPQDMVRLDLEVFATGSPPLKFATIEVRRGGAWHAVEPAAPSGQLTEPFAMPSGYRGIFTFRISLDRRMGNSVGLGGDLNLNVALRRADQGPSDGSLAETTVEPGLDSPTLRADIPLQVVIGEPLEFDLTFENATGVDYPPMHVVVEFRGPCADTFTMAYRAPGESGWTQLTLAPSDQESLVARLPRSGGIDGSDGAPLVYRLRFTTTSACSIYGGFRLMTADSDNAVYFAAFSPQSVRSR